MRPDVEADRGAGRADGEQGPGAVGSAFLLDHRRPARRLPVHAGAQHRGDEVAGVGGEVGGRPESARRRRR